MFGLSINGKKSKYELIQIITKVCVNGHENDGCWGGDFFADSVKDNNIHSVNTFYWTFKYERIFQASFNGTNLIQVNYKVYKGSLVKEMRLLFFR